jgi:hypothetical protein
MEPFIWLLFLYDLKDKPKLFGTIVAKAYMTQLKLIKIFSLPTRFYN